MEKYSRILAIDYGEKRIGLALSDPLKIIASPYKSIENNNKTFDILLQIIKENDVDEIILGCPFQHSDNEKENPLINKIYDFKEKLEKLSNIKIILWDETLTSKEASRRIIEVVPKKMKRRDKSLIDMHSAAIILEEYMKR
ncbi:MAG TPA: Holliday junction resolvase RuvX [Ignavibacteriales bacterium]|nr:Holliday junction resolvase RuvX [Ignavibacteriales bacterium]HOL82204.1 Holliday junction resolvase RuvX [Ignavibacteriales bacterium]HPD68006.1 Holliday junction resolvase RuvX [Ignavibacteriales bacterium]HPP34579.1 Holliday junction resolvase RuvX [Ignavibacteriales bacterium]HRR18029.1 Holliday junction resolvase RuvX [Ignavibacteriales bacterium]